MDQDSNLIRKTYSKKNIMISLIQIIRVKFSIRILVYLFVLCSVEIIQANENTVFVYNHIENCKPTDYYDVNYFLCRECDPQSNLVPSANGENI